LISQSQSLTATWTAATSAVGLAAYSISIGTTAGGTNVVPWTGNGLATQVTRTGLSLVDGQTYFINVVAVDIFGQLGPVSSTPGVVVDLSAPTAAISGLMVSGSMISMNVVASDARALSSVVLSYGTSDQPGLWV